MQTGTAVDHPDVLAAAVADAIAPDAPWATRRDALHMLAIHADEHHSSVLIDVLPRIIHGDLDVVIGRWAALSQATTALRRYEHDMWQAPLSDRARRERHIALSEAVQRALDAAALDE